ncbi:liver carboxylesterase 1 [Myotis myotis]|uniref:liver carboxylesterase 1 n=1 Tax=Myotis myotis TaxID=51298 RepID=UPI00174E143B|nr:liver carboxylesterase 1 [Myotis myotis]
MWFFALVLGSLATCTAWGHPPSPPVVDTVQGQVLGEYVSLEGFAQPVAVFLGVPFAKPPLGPLRFAPPQPAEPWTFVKNTTSYPPMCSQDAKSAQVLSRLFTNRKDNIPLKFSEDCLYLNIYTPADLNRKSRLPVMVWIHGGGLVVGGASTYDGLPLSAHENVVVVIIQYRLGIWGFFSTGDEHSRGNWGHLDQLAALRWVQENIANFGGDPGSVTIFGASAGAESVSVLLNTQRKLLYFVKWRKGEVQIRPKKKGSGPTMLLPRDCHHGHVDTYFSSLFLMNHPIIHLCIYLSIYLSIYHVEVDVSGEGSMNTVMSSSQSQPLMCSVVDGMLLPKMPEELLAEKQLNTVPYIVGINHQEFGWILPMTIGYPISEGKLDQKTASSLLWQSFSFTNIPEALIPAVIEKYLGGTDDPVKKKDRFLDLLGDVVFGVPAVTVARGHRDAGAPTYMYEFRYRPSFLADTRPKTVIGDHGDEIFSVFGAPFLKDGASEEEIKLSKMMMKFWANFARNGNPNGEGLPHWPVYDQKEGYLQIGVPTQAAQKLKDEEVAFFTKLLAQDTARTSPQTEHIEL